MVSWQLCKDTESRERINLNNIHLALASSLMASSTVQTMEIIDLVPISPLGFLLRSSLSDSLVPWGSDAVLPPSLLRQQPPTAWWSGLTEGITALLCTQHITDQRKTTCPLGIFTCDTWGNCQERDTFRTPW